MREPSPVMSTSNSNQRAPTSMALENAAIVFSGASEDAPLWAMMRGNSDMDPPSMSEAKNGTPSP